MPVALNEPVRLTVLESLAKRYRPSAVRPRGTDTPGQGSGVVGTARKKQTVCFNPRDTVYATRTNTPSQGGGVVATVIKIQTVCTSPRGTDIPRSGWWCC